jgi:hypothetical protein
MEEATKVLADQLEEVKKVPYDRLAALMGVKNVESFDITAESGTKYDVEVESLWQDKEGGSIQVNIVVFENDLSSMIPAETSFIMTPDGSVSE